MVSAVLDLACGGGGGVEYLRLKVLRNKSLLQLGACAAALRRGTAVALRREAARRTLNDIFVERVVDSNEAKQSQIVTRTYWVLLLVTRQCLGRFFCDQLHSPVRRLIQPFSLCLRPVHHASRVFQVITVQWRAINYCTTAPSGGKEIISVKARR